MTEKLIQKAKQLAMIPSVCNWFQYFAQETWDRIGYARTRRGLEIWETTITQNLIFEFHTSKDLYNSLLPRTWGIDILESVNESTNGNDIELFVETTDGILFFAVQAKIINHKGFKRAGMIDGNYPFMNHEVSGNNQIDLLCDYADRKGGVPLYLLYNYVKNNFPSKNLCYINFEIEQYGCSISNAKNIRANNFKGGVWAIPTFLELHPDKALPWFVIPCCFLNKTKAEVLKMLQATDLDKNTIKNYDLYDIQTDREWKSLKPFTDIEPDFVEKNRLNSEEENDKIEKLRFNPRFRVIISPNLSYQRKQ
ncbi:MAG: hypothetical protein H7239_02415 [Flavobacterium sp.]|nr:hypothetical protein [Flavobacterium sp.]